MARHRDIRNMDYEDEYDGYDDVYGHSVDDDYYISPSNRQFIYNRESSRDSRYEHIEDDIQEVDEVDELTDTDKAKLNSCIIQIKDTIGPTIVPRNELINLIMKYTFNVELVLNAILEDPKYNKPNADPTEKDDRQCLDNESKLLKQNHTKHFNIPKLLSNPSNNQTQNNGFVIPKIFNLQTLNLSTKNGFNIPNICKSKTGQTLTEQKITIPKVNGIKENIASKSDEKNEFNSLSELVSEHLKDILTINTKKSNVNSVSKKFNNMKLDEKPRESKSCTSTLNENDCYVDLSNALNVSNSLPNLRKSQQNMQENFEIPFIDCDNNRTDIIPNSNMAVLPCALDVKHKLKILVSNHKNASKFGSVMCSTYKHPKVNKLIMSKNGEYKIKIFSFHTMSPDDFISFHLKK